MKFAGFYGVGSKIGAGRTKFIRPQEGVPETLALVAVGPGILWFDTNGRSEIQ